MSSKLRIAVVLIGVLGATVGCEKSPTLVPVKGKIAFSTGSLLPAGTKLLFSPSQGSSSAVGVVQPDGTFEVTHSSGKPGAELGKYTVLLRAPDAHDMAFYRAIPPDYYESGAFLADVTESTPPLELYVMKRR